MLLAYWPVCKFDLILAIPSVLTSIIAACQLQHHSEVNAMAKVMSSCHKYFSIILCAKWRSVYIFAKL